MRLPAGLSIPLVLAAAGLVPAFASCAEAQDSRPPGEETNVSIPEAGAADAPVTLPDATFPDGGCDPSDPGCVSEEITCEDAPWCPVPSNVSARFVLTAVWGTGPSDVWAVGSGGSITHWNGTAWTVTPTTTKNTFHAVWGTGPNDVWAVSMTDAIFHTTGFANGAAAWEQVSGATDASEAMVAHTIWGTAAGDLRIGARARMSYIPDVGSDWVGQFVLTKDKEGNIVWTPEPSGSVHGFFGSATDLWLIADDSARMNNGWNKAQTLHGVAGKGGFVWTPVDSQSTLLLEGIWGSSPDDIWAVGEQGTLRRMKKGMTRWEIVASPTKEMLHAVWGTAADDVWAVGDAGTILHFDGTTWKPSVAAFALGKKPDLYGVWGSSKNDVWIVGDGVALHYTGPKPASQGGGQ